MTEILLSCHKTSMYADEFLIFQSLMGTEAAWPGDLLRLGNDTGDYHVVYLDVL